MYGLTPLHYDFSSPIYLDRLSGSFEQRNLQRQCRPKPILLRHHLWLNGLGRVCLDQSAYS